MGRVTIQRWYLSGPMSGYPELNFPAFERAAAWLRFTYKTETLSAHEIKHPEGTTEWDKFLALDLQWMLRTCDAIVLMEGWPQSKGARLELSTAMALDWPVFFLIPGEHEYELVNMNKDCV